MSDGNTGEAETEPGAQIVDDPPEGWGPAADSIEEKETSQLVTYMTPTQRKAFKLWALDHGLSMSKVVREMIAERMAAPEPDLDGQQGETSSVQAEYAPEASWGQLQEKAVALACAAADLAETLWAELEHGARLPDLATQTGLPTEHLQYLLRAGTALPSHGHPDGAAA